MKTDADEQGPLTKEAKNFLRFVAEHPNKMSSEVSRDLGISMQGKQIREHLQAKELITVTWRPSTTGRPAMFLSATEQGLKILGLKPPVKNDAESLSLIIPPSTVVKALKKPDPHCVHHWIIEPAGAPLSRGKCKNCQGEGEFKNWVDALSNPMASPGI